tara:strand:- start:93 stop:1016 length:924 start_codon:yes stop_codon:yes gene_type:complete
MKKLIFFVLILGISISTFANNGGFKTFVPKGNNYESIDVDIEPKSINNIVKFIGYNSDQFYTYSDYDNKNSKIVVIILKIFTDDIICVLTDDTVTSISKKEVQNYLTGFDVKEEFSSYDIESTLKDGIENKSLTKQFLSEVFQKDISGNSIIINQIGYELHFTNDILSSFNPSDGLNKWAKMWKNEYPSTFRKYNEAASRYWDDENKILNEINKQADAFSNVPNGYQNEYIPLHTNPDGTINFKMLLVTHYTKDITLKEFKELNHGRYELSNEFNDKDNYKRTTYRLNNTLYTFDENGKFVNSYSSN